MREYSKERRNESVNMAPSSRHVSLRADVCGTFGTPNTHRLDATYISHKRVMKLKPMMLLHASGMKTVTISNSFTKSLSYETIGRLDWETDQRNRDRLVNPRFSTPPERHEGSMYC